MKNLDNLELKLEYFDFDAKKAVKEKLVTTNGLRLMLKNYLSIVNDEIVMQIVSEHGKIHKNDIFQREYIENMVTENNWKFFNLLKQTGVIGVCGSGYIISDAQIVTENEKDKFMELQNIIGGLVL